MGKNESESPFRRAFLFGVFQSRKGMELEKLVPIHTLKPWRIWGNQFVQLGLFTPGYLVPQICEHLLDIVRSSSGVHVVNPKSFSDIPVECCGCSPLTEVIIYGFRSKSWGVNGWIMMTAIHHGNPWYLGSLANIPIAFYSILSLLGWNFTNRTPGTPGTPGDTGGHRSKAKTAGGSTSTTAMRRAFTPSGRNGKNCCGSRFSRWSRTSFASKTPWPNVIYRVIVLLFKLMELRNIHILESYWYI